MTTSKSPVMIAASALRAAVGAVPLYRHRFSPKKYAQPQLIACLVLKEFFRNDYRGISAILLDSSDLQRELRLPAVAYYTTLQKASRELLRRKNVHALMESVLTMATDDKIMRHSVNVAANDGTGFDSHHVSRYFAMRRRTTRDPLERTVYARFPKVGVVCDTDNHLVLAGIPEQGPQFDRTHYVAGIRAALKQKNIRTLLADAVYDSEKHHAIARSFGILRHAAKDRMTQRQASWYATTQRDGTTLSFKDVPQTRTGRDRNEYAQAQLRLVHACSLLSRPLPGITSEVVRAQPGHRVARLNEVSGGFLRSSSRTVSAASMSPSSHKLSHLHKDTEMSWLADPSGSVALPTRIQLH